MPLLPLPCPATRLAPPGETEAIQLVREHLDGLFPKVCPSCGKTFAAFREYLLETKPLGAPMSYDAELGHWNPVEPLGAASMANCPCGNTLVLTSAGMPLFKLWRLLHWARIEMGQQGLSQQELLSQLRLEIRRQVLAEAVPTAN